MSARRLALLLTAFTVVLMSAAVGYAEETTSLSQVCPWEQYLDIYVSGDIVPEDLTCKVSNQAAEVIDSGLLADRGITVRTTILLDISKSIPQAVRGNVRSYIDALIETLSDNEQYKIVTFGEQLTVLQDYTNDRYDLANAADKIEFNSQQSMIYDAIYHTLPEAAPVDGVPCYYRTVLITDGADDTAAGVTKEELYLKLQANICPIDVIAVSKSKKSEAEKELAALLRLSGGRYANLFPESDPAELSAQTAVSGVVWLRAKVPENLLDGSTRQIDLSDGITSLRFDTKVPVFDAPEDESTISAEPALPQESSVEETTAETVQTAAANPDVSEEPFSSGGSQAAEGQKESGARDADYTLVVAVGAGVGAFLIAALLIAAAVVRKKKKKQIGSEKRPRVSTPAAVEKPTEILISSGQAADGRESGTLCVRLRSLSDPAQEWNLSLRKPVVIGRETGCEVCLADTSVSRTQCRLYLEKEVVMAENLSQSNLTQLNGVRLNTAQPLKEGDHIKCGRVTLTVDSLYQSGPGNGDRLNKLTDFVSV